MDVLRFECADYTILISTGDISSSWERFKRRVTGAAKTYCNYQSDTVGVLSLMDIDNKVLELQCLNERNQDGGIKVQKFWKERWPVMFETCTYNFYINFNNLSGCPHILHTMKILSDTFSFFPSEKNKQGSPTAGVYTGCINFLNCPGRFRFAFEYKDRNELIHKEVLEMDVVSPKLDIKNDLIEITSLINEEYENYVFDYLTLTFNNCNVTRSTQNNGIIWLSIFKNVIDDYFKACQYIISRPNNHPVRKVYHARPDRIKHWDRRLEEHYKELGDVAERYYFRYTQAELTINTRENRFVKYSLMVLGQKFNSVYAEIKANFKREDIAVEEWQLMDDYVTSFNKFGSHAFFRKIGDFEGFRQESSVLQQRSGYSRVYKSWLMLKSSLDLTGGAMNIGMKKIWELYEIWCFLVMKRLVANVLKINIKEELQKPTEKRCIKEDKKTMFNPFQNAGMEHTIVFINNESGDEVSLHYQHTYNRRSAEMYSVTTEQRPDIVMNIKKNDGFVLTYLYDAKYRVLDDMQSSDIDDNADIDIADYPLPDAINQMHRYRDAIYYTSNENAYPEGKEIIGGYILFPGRAFGETIKKRYFYKSIEKVNIGAYPVLPKHGNDGLLESDLLEKHLEKVLLTNTMYEQIKDSIPQKGLNYSLRPSDGNTIVLVGYVKDKDREKFLKNKIYYTRAEFEKGSLRLKPGFEWTRYLLLHDSKNCDRKLYLLDERGPRIVSKNNLEKLGFAPSHGELFFVFDIEDSEHTIEFSQEVELPNIKAKYEPYFVLFNEMMKRFNYM